MRLWGKTRRINKECLRTEKHDWDWFGGPPNLYCSRSGCTVRGDDLTEDQFLRSLIP